MCGRSQGERLYCQLGRHGEFDSKLILRRPFGPRFFPTGGRSTAIKLGSGDVWVLASTPLTSETKQAIDAMGPVK